MKALRLCAFSVWVAACGADASKPAVTVSVVDAGAQPPGKPAPRAKLGVPRDAALVVTGDLSILMKTGLITDDLARTLDLPEEKRGDLTAAVGLDTSRPATLVIAAPTDATRSLVDELRPLSTSNTPSAKTTDVCTRVLALPRPSLFFRVLLPAANAEALEHAVSTFLEKEDHWHHTRNGLKKGAQEIAISDDDAYVAVDYGSAQAGARADQPVPTLDSQDRMHATFNMNALAYVGFMEGIERTCEVVSGNSVDASQRDRIVAEGLFEAGQLFPLATFDKVVADATLSPLALTVRAKPGPSFTMFGQDALAGSVGITLKGAKVSFETTTAFVRAWPLPGGDHESFKRMVRNSGLYGVMVGLPHFAAEMPFAAIDDKSEPITGDATITKHFERVQAGLTTDWVVAGVLPLGTTRAAAECSLEPVTPCGPKSHLKLGTPVKRSSPNVRDWFAKLVSVPTPDGKPRFGVLVSAQESALTVTFTTGSENAVHLDVETRDLLPGIAAKLPIAMPDHITADVSQADGQLVMKFVGH